MQRLYHKAFTLIELLVVIGIIAILVALILPSLSAAKLKAQGIYCLNNSKQLIVALHIYADDANGWLAPNPDWPTNHMWVRGEMENPEDATNILLLEQSLLAPYDGVSIKIFKCPGDTSNHVRTYSMSQAVGTKPDALAAVDGPWLDGMHENVANHPWRTYGTFASMMNPDPADLWVFMDENQYNINDGAFAVSMVTPTEIIDWPGTYHNRSGGIAFADGHSEIHKWMDGRTRVYTQVASGPHVQEPDNPDILWLQSKTSALVQ
jgi:prepilin-type N-terminal cleavage/methylation domain-containing protein/prepilin-type processing-associated H-X9-DG protein